MICPEHWSLGHLVRPLYISSKQDRFASNGILFHDRTFLLVLYQAPLCSTRVCHCKKWSHFSMGSKWIALLKCFKWTWNQLSKLFGYIYNILYARHSNYIINLKAHVLCSKRKYFCICKFYSAKIIASSTIISKESKSGIAQTRRNFLTR